MITKTITYEDFNGKELTEEFCFHLSEAIIIEMELGKKGGLTAFIKKIVAEEDGEKLVAIFKDLITRTVGRKSEDGRRFIQNQEIVDDFIQTAAYSKLFVELATNAGQAAAFVNGIVPRSMQEELKKQQPITDLPAISDSVQLSKASEQAPLVSAEEEIEKKFEDPSWLPSDKDLQIMNQDQMRRAFQRKQALPDDLRPLA